jgi:hypothetical protein
MSGVLLHLGSQKSRLLEAGRQLAINTGLSGDAMDGLLIKVMAVAKGGQPPFPDNDEEDE